MAIQWRKPNPSGTKTTEQPNAVTAHATQPVPAGQHYQPHASENRSTLLAVNRVYGTKAPEQVVSANMADMRNLSNIILRANGKPILTKTYAPNEAAGLLRDVQVSLGI
jgi:hypothetical protein